MKNNLICPVCSLPLAEEKKHAICPKNHTFDRSAEGYFNFVLNGKASGDDAEMVSARRSFLEKGYYDCLAVNLSKIVENCSGIFLDICCGEGYFTKYLSNNSNFCKFYGFDLSKKAVMKAAKNDKTCQYFVANISNIPLNNDTIDVATSVFSPVNDDEFCRILKHNGLLIRVLPGERHLWQVKEFLYEKPYINDEKDELFSQLKKISSEKIKNTIEIDAKDKINLIKMTPYYHKTSKLAISKFLDEELPFVTEIEFIFNIYVK